jgi:hypothetical protein
MDIKVSHNPPTVVVPNEYVEWLEDEKAVLWAESEAMAAFYKFLREAGVPDGLAEHLTAIRYQNLLMATAQETETHQ